MKPASELTDKQRAFLAIMVPAVDAVAKKIDVTPREFTECLERMYIFARDLLPKYEDQAYDGEQTICE